MPPRTRLQIAKPDIVKTFEESNRRIFAHADIVKLLSANRYSWRLAESTTVQAFLDYLLKSTRLEHARIAFPQRPVIRYTWGAVPTLTIVQSIDREGYFSHFTAIRLHGLTDQLPKTIYFNHEQVNRGGGGQLTQEAIDRAFRGKCRVTKNVARFRGHNVFLLNGQNTAQLGVIDLTTSDGEELRVTNVERTLIDATVRPVYAGGVAEVASAFRSAQEVVSVNKLVAMLRELNFTYPYHQAIGYYLDRAGVYKPAQIDLLRQFPIEFDFYLDYSLHEPVYVKQWRLFVPKGF
ncbi:MAG: hypothetical protein HYS13_02125 [Planctomycetia bacterium]|nr:hypothetical protein [Planctomycetia bacterium]